MDQCLHQNICQQCDVYTMIRAKKLMNQKAIPINTDRTTLHNGPEVIVKDHNNNRHD